MNDGLYVQYGCGWDAPDGWINFDASPTLRIEKLPVVGKRISRLASGNPLLFPSHVRYGDIVSGLPVDEGSCQGVYCAHVLEHLSLADFRAALRNTWKIMGSGALFRLVMPDLEVLARRYLDESGPESALTFMTESGLGEQRRPRGVLGQLREAVGNSRHRWLWDYRSLERELADAGFTQVRRASIGDASDPMFALVERNDRWHDCLGVECRRA